MLPSLGTGIGWIIWGTTALAVILFVGIYAAFDPKLYSEGLKKLVPIPQRERAGDVLSRLRTVLTLWLVGRVASMAIVGIATAIFLWAVGIPMAFSLAVVAAFLTFIPNIGPILAAVPQALLALQVSTNMVAYVIFFNIALQTVESYLITPMIQRHQATLPPASTIFAQLIMGILFGVIGIVMAAPVVASVMLIVQLLYVRDELHDEEPGELTSKTERKAG